jgi:transposase
MNDCLSFGIQKKEPARSLKERIDKIVIYCTHEITNAVTEKINSKIISMKRRAGGYRNIECFKTGMVFYRGLLDFHRL